MDKVLIIDDSVECVDILYELLSPLYDTSVCVESTEALSFIKENQFDLIILDINMPKLNGFELLAQIRNLDMYQHCPIILASAHVSEENLDKGLMLGATEYLRKPYHKQILLNRVRDQIKLHNQGTNHNSTYFGKTNESIKSMHLMLENMCELIESKDYSTGAHIMRAGHYFKILVSELSKDLRYKSYLNSVDIDDLVMASKMHDIGKISIPDNILNKPGLLSTEEFATMQTHSYHGYHILNKISERISQSSLLDYGEVIALSHHEKWNGKGYPKKLKHDEIPLIARIMSVVDVYDALTTDRVYKKAIKHEEAIKIIKDERGISFDPAIVDAFLMVQDKIINTFYIYKENEIEKLSAKEMYATYDKKDKTMYKKNSALVIDDDPITREIMGNQLINHGFSVQFSENGYDAIMMLKNHSHDFTCILSDIDMPIINGYEFIKILRKENKELIVFSITDSDYTLNYEKAIQHGFDGCLLKPLDCDLFLYKYHELRYKYNELRNCIV